MPDWISKTLGRVLRSREWTNSSSDTAMALSWLVCRSDFYRNLWLLDVNCLQSLSLLIIPPSSRQNVKGEPNQGKTALGGQVLVRSGYSSHFLPGAERMSHCSQAQEEQLEQGKAENRQEAEWVKPSFFFLRLHFLLTLKQVWGWGVLVWTVTTQSNEVGKLPMPVHPHSGGETVKKQAPVVWPLHMARRQEQCLTLRVAWHQCIPSLHLGFSLLFYLHTLGAFILNLITKEPCVSCFWKSGPQKRVGESAIWKWLRNDCSRRWELSGLHSVKESL